MDLTTHPRKASSTRETGRSSAQEQWAALSVAGRLSALRPLRNLLAANASAFADAMPAELNRSHADTLAAEVLPLLEAWRFLQREAAAILQSRHLGRKGLPFWLSGIHATIERVPMGTILVIAPSNYPLFLPGVQTLQGLVAGNAVVWKPGRGGLAVAKLMSRILNEAGLPAGLLRVTGESANEAIAAIEARPDKIIFTGSASAGKSVSRLAAEYTIPVVAELSGCDAVFVLPGANPARVVDALCFGMRLNGSATCMAPRRLILVGNGHESLLTNLQQRFSAMDAIFLGDPLRAQLRTLLADATAAGADIRGKLDDVSMQPILILDGKPAMQAATSDIFAPILTVLHAADSQDALVIEAACPYGLTATVFGEEPTARKLAAKLKVGTVIINDLIVPTADPRIPFGGRRASGFGTTRGVEGLLEMTAAKVISTRRGDDRKHYQPTTENHRRLFAGVIDMVHRSALSDRWAGLKSMIAAAKQLKQR